MYVFRRPPLSLRTFAHMPLGCRVCTNTKATLLREHVLNNWMKIKLRLGRTITLHALSVPVSKRQGQYWA